MPNHDAVVIIPNFNGLRFLPSCIGALEKQTCRDFDLLVVENGSTDGSAEWLHAHGVPCLVNHENLGFAGGVNAGIRATTQEYVILLNNDTVPAPEFVERLLGAIKRHRRIFSVSAKMLCVQDPSLVDDAGDGISLFGWAYQRGRELPAALYERPSDIFSSCAGAAVYRRSLLEETGLFDETHFAYLEDIDLCWRARLLGYFNRYEPGACVVHYGSATSGSRYNSFKVRLSSRNHIWLMYKNQPAWQLMLNAPWLLAGLLIKGMFFRKRGFGTEWLSGTLEGLRTAKGEQQADFARIPLYRFLAIEWEMVLGTAEYISQYVKREKG